MAGAASAPPGGGTSGSLDKVSWMHARVHSLSGRGEGEVVELTGGRYPYLVKWETGSSVGYDEDDLVARLEPGVS